MHSSDCLYLIVWALKMSHFSNFLTLSSFLFSSSGSRGQYCHIVRFVSQTPNIIMATLLHLVSAFVHQAHYHATVIELLVWKNIFAHENEFGLKTVCLQIPVLFPIVCRIEEWLFYNLMCTIDEFLMFVC